MNGPLIYRKDLTRTPFEVLKTHICKYDESLSLWIVKYASNTKNTQVNKTDINLTIFLNIREKLSRIHKDT